MNRRDFLKKVIKYFFLIFIIVPIIFIFFYLFPFKKKEGNIKFVFLIDEDKLPKKGVRNITYKVDIEGNSLVKRIFLMVTNKGITAFSPICTHLGCFISWDNNKKEFICPCHGGKYNINGEVITGPPPRPLIKMPLKIIDEKVYVGLKT